MKEKSAEYFNNGYSCSESVVKAAVDEGLCDPNLISCATAFSGGMSLGCLCGAIAGAQLVIGNIYGRDNNRSKELLAKEKAAVFMEEFIKINRHTCCRTLTRGQEGPERKIQCTKKVYNCAEILEEILRTVNV